MAPDNPCGTGVGNNHTELEVPLCNSCNERATSHFPCRTESIKWTCRASLANHISLSFPTKSHMLCYLHLKLSFRFVTWSVWTFCKTHSRWKDLPKHMRVSWSFGRRCWCWKAASTCPDPRMQLLKLILCSGYKVALFRARLKRSEGNLRLLHFFSRKLTLTGFLKYFFGSTDILCRDISVCFFLQS